MSAPEEMFDVCDEHDNVIGRAPRSVVHAQRLLHRAVHIWIWDRRGRLLVHLRTASKDEYPSCYTSSASGHVGSGESYEMAAHRELLEELGLSGPLKFETKLAASPETANEHTVLYSLVTDAVPTPDPQEIESLEYLTRSELTDRIANAADRITPPFRALVQWWLQTSAGPPGIC